MTHTPHAKFHPTFEANKHSVVSDKHFIFCCSVGRIVHMKQKRPTKTCQRYRFVVTSDNVQVQMKRRADKTLLVLVFCIKPIHLKSYHLPSGQKHGNFTTSKRRNLAHRRFLVPFLPFVISQQTTHLPHNSTTVVRIPYHKKHRNPFPLH